MRFEPSASNLFGFGRRSVTIMGLCLSIVWPAFGDTLRYLGQGNQSLMQMAKIIDEAKSSIDMSYYILRPCDASTKILLSKLESKSRQGVKVRIVLDAWPNSTDVKKALQTSLRRSGIELRYFNRKGFTPAVNYRMHGKIMLVDGERYITGGRNLDDNYFSVGDKNFIDRDVFVEGESAKGAQASFNHLWNADMVFSFEPASSTEVAEFEKTCLKTDAKMQSLISALEAETRETLAAAPEFKCPEVKFAVDDPKFWKTYKISNETADQGPLTFERLDALIANKETSTKVMEFINGADKSLVIENWGYIPTAEMGWALRKLRSDNIPILVVTNKATDEGDSVNVLNQYYSRRDNQGPQRILALSALGSLNDRWSQTPAVAEWIIHSKVFVSNLENVAVTSFNFDPRSYHTNIESGLFVRSCAPFAQHVLKETGRLVEMYEADKLCPDCQKKLKSSFLEKVAAWLKHEML